jgi:hypothetical protein
LLTEVTVDLAGSVEVPGRVALNAAEADVGVQRAKGLASALTSLGGES